MKFIKTTLIPEVQTFRDQLYREFNAPLDTMWELLYIASAEIHLIQEGAQDIGYCCIDAGNSLNQIYLVDSHKWMMKTVIEELVDSGLITSAKLSSIEPISFNVCLAMAQDVKANTFNYRYSGEQEQQVTDTPMYLRPIASSDLIKVKLYLKEEIGFEDSFGYTKNLLERQEMYLIEESGELIATGECRLSDTQPEYADVGMIVRQTQRKKGLGAKVLSELASLARSKGRTPICSTTVDNIGSQKAISRSGFYHTSTIFDLSFQ